MRTLLARIRALFDRRRLDNRLDEELRFHLEMEAEKHRRAGLTSKQAAEAARRAFGGEQQVKERYRDQRGLPMLETLFKDLQYSLRTMRRSPGFTAIAVLSLALGIGANTAIFTLIDAVLLRQLPVEAPSELVAIGDTSSPGQLSHGGHRLDILSYPIYERLRGQNHSFTGLLATGRSGRLGVRIDGGAEEPVRGRLVSDNYFEVLGLRASRGRVFATGDDKKPNPAVIVSYDYWKTRFAGDPAIVGRTLALNGSVFTIIGVGPSGFRGEVVGSAADVWLPLSMQPQVNPGDARLTRSDASWLLLLGRLKPGVSIDLARAEMNALGEAAVVDFASGKSLSQDEMRQLRASKTIVEPGGKGFSGLRSHFQQPLLILMFLVGFVLLIACANVANLLLARASVRQKEISVRLAVGASRLRLIRQLLTESIFLASIGGATGVLLAWTASGLLLQLASNGPTPIPLDVAPNGLMLAFTAAVSIFTGILFGLAPALRSTRVDLAPALKESARSVTGSKGWQLGKLLVVAQVALSLLLLVGAGLFVRSLVNLETLDVGFSRSNLVVAELDAIGSGYTPPQQLVLSQRVVEHLRAMPGIQGATVSVNGIFNGTDSNTDGISTDFFTSTRKEDAVADFDSVGPQYFKVVGVPLLAGREFDEHDRQGAAPVVILNETMARFYFRNTDPVGKILRSDNSAYTIVGVTKDMKQQALKGKAERRFYKPFFQSTGRIPGICIEIRTQGDAGQSIPAIRREILALDPNLKILSVDSVRDLIDQTIVDERLIAQLSGFFGALALLLAATGLYGIMAYTISRRSNEIGLRMALGAARSDVIRMILQETLTLVVSGIAIGLPAALAASQLIAASLTGLSARDPSTLVLAAAIMVSVSILAAWAPARRAARIDPLVALRQE